MEVEFKFGQSMAKNQKTKKLRLKKDFIRAIVFDSNNPPDFVNLINEREDDESGNFEIWEAGNKEIKQGDLLIYYKNGRYQDVVIIPPSAIGKIFEE